MGDIQILEAEIDRLGGVIAALSARADAAETDAGRLAEGLASCRDYLAALSRSGAVAGHEMEMPSYEVTEPLAAHEALNREPGEGN